MKQFKVNSSCISTISYAHNKLYVGFNSGLTYRYRGVKRKTFKAMLNSDSQGKFYNKEIKGKFDSVRC